MLGVQKLVLEKIRQMDRGTIFFIDDFIELGSSGAVRIALMELKKQGIILLWSLQPMLQMPILKQRYLPTITVKSTSITNPLRR